MFANLKTLVKLFRSNRSDKIPLISPKPNHVAVIMDGNGRWANSKGLTRVAGHKRGVDAVKSLIKDCIEYEIPVLSLFAFSSENWNRPESEVDALMDLLANALETQTKKLDENQICLRLIGDLSRFNSRIQKLADSALNETQNHTKLTLNVAVNYGGRWDISQALQKIGEKIKNGQIEPQEINETLISDHLSTAGIEDPDLFIRTSGEYRISNFMLWQAAYSEFYFTDTLWPDFDRQAFNKALVGYTKRERRYGDASDVPAEVVDKLAPNLVTESPHAEPSKPKIEKKKGAKHA